MRDATPNEHKVIMTKTYDPVSAKTAVVIIGVQICVNDPNVATQPVETATLVSFLNSCVSQAQKIGGNE